MPDMSSIRPEVVVSTEKNKSKKRIRKIVLTLENCLLPEEKLKLTPSQKDGLDSNTEMDLRIWGCELIQTAGTLLKLPQVAMATGQVLLQRFYFSKSLARYPVDTTAMACVCLASKIEEAPRRIRDVINVFFHVRQIVEEKPIKPVILDQNYINLKTQVIKAERRVLKELGFCVHVKHPHKLIVTYLNILDYHENKAIMQMAWNYMNDSLRTDVFVRYEPEVIACACIYLTARKLEVALPSHPKWFELFGVKEIDIKRVCVRILQLYDRKKPNIVQLEKRVEDVKRIYQEMKMKVRENDHKSSPMQKDSPKSIDGSHNAWGGFISRSGNHNPMIEKEVTKKRSVTRSPSPIKSKRRRTRSRSRSKGRYTKSSKRRSNSRGKHSDEDRKVVKSKRDSSKDRESRRSKERESRKNSSRSHSRSRSPVKKRKDKDSKYYNYDKYSDKSKYNNDKSKYDKNDNDYKSDKYRESDYKSSKNRDGDYKHKKYYDDDKYKDESSDYDDKRSKSKKDKRR